MVNWGEILTSFAFSTLASVISGVIVSFICAYLIEKRIKQREEYKNRLLLSFLFLKL